MKWEATTRFPAEERRVLTGFDRILLAAGLLVALKGARAEAKTKEEANTIIQRESNDLNFVCISGDCGQWLDFESRDQRIC